MANATSQTSLPELPASPSALTNDKLVARCRSVYQNREAIVGAMDAATAYEAFRRVSAIEKYLASKHNKAEAQRAARVLEAAVGEALGPAEPMAGPGRGNKTPAREPAFSAIPERDRHRFRKIAQYRDVWFPKLDERPLSRKAVLDLIQASTEAPPEPSDGVKAEKVEDLLESAQKYGTIYADPPWEYSNKATRSAVEGEYKSTMTVDELCELPVAQLAADNAHLHLWTTNAFLFDAKRVMEAWGFTYKSVMVWVKPQLGIGNYWRVSHEFLLFGMKGSAPFRDRSIRSWLEAERGRHSAKPEAFRTLIERVSPPPYLELFGRQHAPGWSVVGNEVMDNLYVNV